MTDPMTLRERLIEALQAANEGPGVALADE